MEFAREHFLARLRTEFPEVLARLTKYDEGRLHCEVSEFRRATEMAMDAERFWIAERHFRLVEELLKSADPELRNALNVSYLRDLALGICTPERLRAVKERMPKWLRAILLRHHEQWK
jgi:hypothetical protein